MSQERGWGAETYGLELNTLLSVGELQGKERPVVTHVVNFIPPTRPIWTQWHKEKGEEKTHDVIAVTKSFLMDCST